MPMASLRSIIILHRIWSQHKCVYMFIIQLGSKATYKNLAAQKSSLVRQLDHHRYSLSSSSCESLGPIASPTKLVLSSYSLPFRLSRRAQHNLRRKSPPPRHRIASSWLLVRMLYVDTIHKWREKHIYIYIFQIHKHIARISQAKGECKLILIGEARCRACTVVPLYRRVCFVSIDYIECTFDRERTFYRFLKCNWTWEIRSWQS